MAYRHHAASTTTDPDEDEPTFTWPGFEDLLTVREVATRLRVDVTTVRRWISQGLLEAVTLPHRGKRRAYRIKKQTLDRLL